MIVLEHTYTADSETGAPFSRVQWEGGEYCRGGEGAPRPTGFSPLTLSHTGKEKRGKKNSREWPGRLQVSLLVELRLSLETERS